jgi:hypothetical protein
MRTVYVQRWSEDLSSAAEGGWEDFHSAVRAANDAFIDGRLATSDSGGFLELVAILGLSP